MYKLISKRYYLKHEEKLPRLKEKQKLLEEIFQKAYVRWGNHYRLSLYYSFVHFQTIPLPTRSERTYYLEHPHLVAIFANRLYI